MREVKLKPFDKLLVRAAGLVMFATSEGIAYKTFLDDAVSRGVPPTQAMTEAALKTLGVDAIVAVPVTLALRRIHRQRKINNLQ